MNNILNALLSSDGYTPVNKFLAKEFGFLNAGYFGELIRQRDRFGQEEFFFSQKNMELEIGISEYEQRTAIKRFIDVGFVSVVKKGLPAKYYYKINDELVIKYISSKCLELYSYSGQKTEALVVQNLEDQCLKNGSTSGSKFEAHTINKNNNKNNNNSEKKSEALFIDNENTNIPATGHLEKKPKIDYKSEYVGFREKRNNVKPFGVANKGLPKVIKDTEDIFKLWIKKRKEYTVEEIIKATENYVNYMASVKPSADNNYYQHRFTFSEFLSRERGLQKFINFTI